MSEAMNTTALPSTQSSLNWSTSTSSSIPSERSTILSSGGNDSNSTTKMAGVTDSSSTSDVINWTPASDGSNWTSVSVSDVTNWTSTSEVTNWAPSTNVTPWSSLSPNTTDPVAISQTTPHNQSSASLLWPVNFTFGDIMTGELYLPDDVEIRTPLGSTVSSILNQTFVLNESLFADCSINATYCGDGVSTSKVFTDEDVWAENEKFARQLIPAMVFIGILMLFGIIGNLLVVYIYGYRFKSATQHFLIVCLACFDLLMSCMAMPTEIADLRFHHMFSSLFACKLLRFITMFSSISSSFTLVTIAMDRHRRVTRPLAKQMTVRRARIWEVANVLGALFFSWPLLVMTGLRSSETSIPGLFGTDCSFSDQFRNTKFPLAYNAVLGTGFVVLTIVIGILYFRIWKTARGHRVYMANRTRGSFSGTSLCDVRINGSMANLANGTPGIHQDDVGATQDKKETHQRRSSLSITPEKRSPRTSSYERESSNSNQVEILSEQTPSLFSPSNEGSSQISVPLSNLKQNVYVSNGELASSNNDASNFLQDNNSKLKSSADLSTVGLGDSNSLNRKSKSLDNLLAFSGQAPTHIILHSPSLSIHKRTLSPTLSGSSLTPSPKLRSRSLKIKSSYNASIKSEDLRPMSSLLESVSKSLLESGALVPADQRDGNCVATVEDDRLQTKDGLIRGKDSDSQSAVGTDNKCQKDNSTLRETGIVNYLCLGSGESQFRDSGIMCSSCADVNSSLESQHHCGCLPWHSTVKTNLSVKDSVGEPIIPTGDHKNSELLNKSPTYAVDGTKKIPDSIMRSPYHKPSDDVNQVNNSANASFDIEVADSLPLVLKEKGSSIQNKGDREELSRDQGEIPEFTQSSFMEMIAKSDFSHLITPRSKPMAIPDEEADSFELSVSQSPTNRRDSACDGSRLSSADVPKSDTLESPTSNSSSQCRFRPHDPRNRANSENNIRISSSSSSNNIRRSTVVSVLERYRIHSGSMASLDNITSASGKSATRRISRSFDKTTIVAFAISSVFVLSFLPYLILMFIRSFVKDFDYNLDDARLCVYNIFLRFYLINSAVNPLMYGLLNQRFRHECKRLFVCIFCKREKT